MANSMRSHSSNRSTSSVKTKGIVRGGSNVAEAGSNKAVGPDVLIVDDNSYVLATVELTLKYCIRGCTPCGCINGPEALRKLRDRSFHLAFVDLAMPEMSGFELARRIRALENELQRPAMPLVAISAFDRSEVWPDCRAAGYTEIIIKPFGVTEISSCTHRLAGGA